MIEPTIPVTVAPPEYAGDEALFNTTVRNKTDALLKRFESLMERYPISSGGDIPPDELADIAKDTDTVREEIRQLLPRLVHPQVVAEVTDVLSVLDEIAGMLASPTGF